ncbi:hypothetical protein RJ640_008697 [Escallonia rubra]|uniref:DEAD/DEAH-box helicase domain-containing protein n=1 Tax=Escallonia rubra TaxID=112253 RepID=A0AA88RTK1_9ASTE|nr:hypothetical protein RJ640_008697 [Escallonia rubra]
MPFCFRVVLVMTYCAFCALGKDLIGLAQTGSGKTGAFAIPILQALLETLQAFFACVLSNTLDSSAYFRELAIQIAEQFEALGSGIGVKCAVVSFLQLQVSFVRTSYGNLMLL